jgi:DNA-binding transcriptional ArsR family regulator
MACLLVSRSERLTHPYRSCRLTDVPATAETVLDALGDASRRAILEKLHAGPLPVGVLADRLPISRPAVSQHLRVLKQAELVVETTAGTRRLYRINRSGLKAVRDYLDRFWGAALENFVALAEEEAAKDAVAEAAAVLDQHTDPDHHQPPEP